MKVEKPTQNGYPDKDKLPDKVVFTLVAAENQGILYKKNDEEPKLSGMVIEPELGFLSFGKSKSFFVSINDLEELLSDKSSEKYQRIENNQTGNYEFRNYEKNIDLVVTLKKDGDNTVAETSNEKVKLEVNKHFAVNARGLHFFEMGFLCDYLGYSWDIKEVGEAGKDKEISFEVKLKKNK